MSFWGTASKIAVRELRASVAKFLFVVVAVAIGVGALSGVRGFSQGFQRMLFKEARQLMAADLSMRDFQIPTEAQQQELESLERRGAVLTRITETVSMAASAVHLEPVMVSVKAVDPAHYPFYGKVKLSPEMPLAQALDAQSVAVGEDLLPRLNVKVGDQIRLGAADFQIKSLVTGEPDRMSGSFNVGLRVMMSREGLDRTQLIRPGSRASQRFLFKLPVTLDVAEVKRELKNAFVDAQVVDFRESNPTITRSLDRATRFLSLVSLIALIVGALGVATTMQGHLEQRLDGIAVMKSMGARSSQILQIYIVETLILGMVGAWLGLGVGVLVQLAFPVLIARLFPNLDPGVTWDWASLAQALLIGVLSTLLFTLPPLLRIRTIRPSLILRRDMAETRPPFWERLRQSKLSVAVSALVVAGMGGVAAWLSEVRIGVYFTLGLVVSLLVLGAVAWALLKGLRVFLRTTSLRLPSNIRHGLANLYRPGNHATAILVALGVGVTFTLTVYLVQRSLISQLTSSAPPGMPNVFFVGITPEVKDGLQKLVNAQPGVAGGLEISPAVAVRLTHVDGRELKDLELKGWGRRFLQTRSVTWAPEMPEGFEVYGGTWWKKGEEAPRVAVAEDAAKILNLRAGTQLDFVAGGKPFRAEVAAFYRPEGFRMGGMSEFIFTPKTLEGLPALYFGGARVEPGKVGHVQRVSYEQYPAVTVINVAEVLAIVQEVVDQASTIIRFLSAFAIFAGIIILASSVAGTRLRRIREVVILKTLGGTRSRIAGIFSMEFLLLGGVAGLMGGLLGAAFSAFILRSIWETEIKAASGAVAVCVVATALLANAAGWLASARILGQKPLEVLREE
jgi:putative ABC transport system permease protein